jgi:truncated hemoglobin YjbI
MPRARLDPVIGPVFNNAVKDWNEHLRKLYDFWSLVMLTSCRYKGNPMAAHVKQPIKAGAVFSPGDDPSQARLALPEFPKARD